MNDLKFALRQLLKNPGFTGIAVLTLALGIGANSAILSIINSILFKPVHARHPEQLVGIYQHDQDDANAFHQFSYPDFIDLRSAPNSPFSDVFAFSRASVAMQGELTQEVRASLVSANYFSALGISPMLGRVFLPDEETSGAPVAVLSHSFWKKLGSDPSIVSSPLKTARGQFTVIGVMPPGFTGAQVWAPDLFLPVGVSDVLQAGPAATTRLLVDRSDRRLMLMGRLKPGVKVSNVNAALSVLNQQFDIPDPAQPKARTLISASPSRFNYSDAPSRKIQGLAYLAVFAFALATLVLLISCLNLANMMLARGAARSKEMSVRLALGAGRRRILRQLLTEGLLLAFLGAAAGVMVSQVATGLLAAWIYGGPGMPPDFPVFNLSPDIRVVTVLLLLSGLCTLVFALGPAWKLIHLDFNESLKQRAGEDFAGKQRRFFGVRDLFVVGQMASTLALLVAAALFSRSAVNAYVANPGFEFGSTFCLRLNSGLVGYTDARAWELNRAAIEKLASLPGVESVSSALHVPFGSSFSGCQVQIGGAPRPAAAATTLAEGKGIQAMYNAIGKDYFHTLGIPLQRGREFERREEVKGAQPVAIISQNLADELWPNQDPLGRTVQFPSFDGKAPPRVMTVVGIVPAVQWRLFRESRPAAVYVPIGQDFSADYRLLVRAAPGMSTSRLMLNAREELHRLDPGIPLTSATTLVTMHRDSPEVRVARLGSILFSAFGGLALVLSSLGIYGLKSYVVTRRTREIGIRMALGATASKVVRMFLRESIWLAAIGLGLGMLLAFGVGRVAVRYLYEVSAMDAVTFVAAPTVLFGVALVACWLPARRATQVHPMEALRNE